MATVRKYIYDVSTRGTQQTQTQINKLSAGFTNMAKSIGAAAAGIGLIGAGRAVADLARLAAQTENVRRAFNQLADEPQKMLDSMKKATAGVISEMRLMQEFNTAALLGLPLDRFDEMLAIARGAAQATGQSMDFMLQSIVTALGRGSKLMLDNLGIIIDTQAAYEKYAVSIGKVASELTDMEKKQAFVNEALDLGNANLEKMGGTMETNLDQIELLKAEFEDLKVEIGEELLPAVVSVSKGLIELAKGFKDVTVGLAEFSSQFNIAQQIVEGYTKQIDHLMARNAEMRAEFMEGQREMVEEFGDPFAGSPDPEIRTAEFLDFMDLQIEKTKELGMVRRTFHAERLRQIAIGSASAENAVRDTLRGELVEATAGYISSVLQSVPFPFNVALAAGAGAAVGQLFDSVIPKFAKGGDFVTNGPQMIMVGDNPGGRERVQITPESSPNINGPQGGFTLVFNAPVTDAQFVRDTIVPEMQKAMRMGLA